MDEDARRQRIAFHEAGHVVVGQLLGLKLIDADIYPDEAGGNGHTNFQPGADGETRSRDFIERVVTTFLAGFTAETRHAGVQDWDGAGWDLDISLREWVSMISADPEERAEFLHRLTARAEELVNRPDVACHRPCRALPRG